MIRMGTVNEKGQWLLALILEPDDLEMLRVGRCIGLNLNELLGVNLPFRLDMAIDYSPDLPWVVQEFKRRGQQGAPGAMGPPAEGIAQIVAESRNRPEVRNRPQHPPEMLYDSDAEKVKKGKKAN